jgi:hypothetical protein
MEVSNNFVTKVNDLVDLSLVQIAQLIVAKDKAIAKYKALAIGYSMDAEERLDEVSKIITQTMCDMADKECPMVTDDWQMSLANAIELCQPVMSTAEKRWFGVSRLVDEILSEEGATVTFSGPNPDFNGLPNEVITVVRGPAWTDETFRGDTLVDCLNQAISSKHE